MNKAIIGLIALIILASAGFVLLGSDNSEVEVSQNTTQNTDAQPANTTDEVAAEPQAENSQDVATGGEYVEFSDEKLEESAGTKRVVFFHADWCSTCNFFEGQIEKEGVPDEITVLKANYDTATALKEKYGVNIQSTFVLLDESGNVERTWPFASGLMSIQDLYNAVKEA